MLHIKFQIVYFKDTGKSDNNIERRIIMNIDYFGYITCWDKFLQEYFPNQKNVNKSPVEQLKQHICIC